MSTTIITTTTITLEPTIDCAYTPLTTWTTSGTEVDFGRGTSSITVDPSGSTNAVLFVGMEGNNSLVDKVEYDGNIGNIIMWQWLDSSSNTHQSTTGISETTLSNGSTRVTIDVNGSLDTTIQSFMTFTGTSSSAERVLSNFRVYDTNDSILNMEVVTTSTSTTTVAISPFTLPREDWYDEDGRIYKDAVIENLNAIESKLNELNSLSAFDADVPDVSTLHLSDVTLTSDESKVVNLESFLDIFGMVNYPAELEFSGTTLKKISYWSSSYTYVTRTNKSTDASTETPYVFYNFSDNTVTTESTATTASTTSTLLGCYVDGRIVNLHTPLNAKLNLMYLLGNMDKSTQTDYVRTGQDYHSFTSGQQSAISHVESKGASHAGNMTFYEQGR